MPAIVPGARFGSRLHRVAQPRLAHDALAVPMADHHSVMASAFGTHCRLHLQPYRQRRGLRNVRGIYDRKHATRCGVEDEPAEREEAARLGFEQVVSPGVFFTVGPIRNVATECAAMSFRSAQGEGSVMVLVSSVTAVAAGP